MRERREVVLSIEADYTGSLRSSLGSLESKFQHIEPAIALRIGKESCRNLCWPLGNAHQQPDAALISKHPRIQQACNFHPARSGAGPAA